MFVNEHEAKRLFSEAGVNIPVGHLAMTVDQAVSIATNIDAPVMVKAQVPAGKRNKAGAIISADTPTQAGQAAQRLLGESVGEFIVDAVLVEAKAEIERELYVAVTVDPASRAPLVMVTAQAGVDVEQAHEANPD